MYGTRTGPGWRLPPASQVAMKSMCRAFRRRGRCARCCDELARRTERARAPDHRWPARSFSRTGIEVDTSNRGKSPERRHVDRRGLGGGSGRALCVQPGCAESGQRCDARRQHHCGQAGHTLPARWNHCTAPCLSAFGMHHENSYRTIMPHQSSRALISAGHAASASASTSVSRF